MRQTSRKANELNKVRFQIRININIQIDKEISEQTNTMYSKCIKLVGKPMN